MAVDSMAWGIVSILVGLLIIMARGWLLAGSERWFLLAGPKKAPMRFYRLLLWASALFFIGTGLASVIGSAT